jgi:hypothetical protein
MKIDLNLLMGSQENRQEIIKYFSRNKYAPLVTALSMLSNPISHVFDVGVRGGTPVLYKAFPDANFILFDPQEGGVELLKSKPRIYSFVNIALGSQPGVLKINEMGNKTSFMMRTPLTAASIEKSYNVEVSTLDAQLQILDCSLGVCGRTTAGSTFSPGKS